MAVIIWLGIFVYSRIEAEVNCGLTSNRLGIPGLGPVSTQYLASNLDNPQSLAVNMNM